MLKQFSEIRKFLALAFILLFSMLGISQEISYGAKAGINISSLRGDYPDDIDKKPVIGFHLGGFAGYSVNEKIAVRPELLFSRQGVNTDQTLASSDESLSQAFRLNYLNLAIMGRYKVLDKLHVEFGPQIGYVVSAKLKLEFEDSSDPSRNETVEYDVVKGNSFDFLGVPFERKRIINRLDLGLNIGASYELNEDVFVQLRYNHGLLRLTKDSESNEGLESWNLKNAVLQFSVGYQF